MPEIGVASLGIEVDQSGLKQGLSSALAALSSWHGKAMKYATIAVSVVGAAGVAKAFKSVIDTTAEFEQAMAMVKSVTMASEEEFAKLQATAKELGKTSKWTMTEIAGGMEFLARAGFSVDEIIESIGATSDLAASQMMDFSRAADIMTNILTGMRMETSEAARVADVLAKTASTANVNVEMMGESFKYFAPLAAEAGFSIEEMAAAVGRLGDAGIQGSMAGTALRFAISELIGMSDNFVSKLESVGLAVTDLTDEQGNLKSFVEIIRAFEEAGLDAADMVTLFGKRAGPAMAVLLAQGADALKTYTEELENAGGTVQQMAEIQLDTLQGQLTVLKGSWDLLKTTIGEKLVPVLTDFVRETLIPMVNQMAAAAEKTDGLTAGFRKFLDAVANGFKWLMENGDKVWNIIDKVAKAFAALIALKVAAWLANVVSGFASLAAKATAAATAIGSTGTGLIGALGGLGGVLAGGALAAGFFALGRAIAKVRNEAEEAAKATEELNEANRRASEALEKAGITEDERIRAFTGRVDLADIPKDIWRVGESILYTEDPLAKVERKLEEVKEAGGDVNDTFVQLVGGILTAAEKMDAPMGQILAAVQKLEEQLEEVPEERRTELGLDEEAYQAALAMLETIRTYIESLPEEVRIKTVIEAGPEFWQLRNAVLGILMPEEKKQAGGPVPGTGRGDKVPALLEPGEFVVPRWMMGIPWLRALLLGVWARGRKYQKGGEVAPPAGPIIGPRGEEYYMFAGAWTSLEDIQRFAEQARLILGKTGEAASDLKDVLENINWNEPLEAAQKLAEINERAADMTVEDVNAVAQAYRRLVSSIESAIEWLEKTRGDAGDLPEILKKIKAKFNDTPDAIDKFMEALTVEELKESPEKVAQKMRLLASQDLRAASEKTQELISAMEEEIEQRRMFGFDTKKTEEALNRFRKTLRGTANVLKDRLEELAAGALQGVGALQEILGALDDVSPALSAFVSGMEDVAHALMEGDILGGILRGLVALFTSAIAALQDRLSRLQETLAFYEATIVEAARSLGQVAGSVASTVLGPLGGFVQTLVNAWVGAIHMTFLEGLDLLRAGIDMLLNFATGLIDSFLDLIRESRAYAALQEETQTIWRAVADLFGQFLWPLVAALRYLREYLGIQKEINETLGASLNVPAGYKVARTVWAAARPGEPWQEPGAAIPEWADALGKKIADALIAFFETLGVTSWNDLVLQFQKMAEAVWNWIIEHLPALLGAIAEAINVIGQILAEHGISLDSIADWLAKGIEWLIEHLPDIAANVINFILGVFGLLGDVWEWFQRNFPTWDEIRDKWDEFIGALNNLPSLDDLRREIDKITKALNAFKTVLSYTIAIAVGAIVGAIAGAFPLLAPAVVSGAILGALGGAVLSAILNAIPKMQEGGLVRHEGLAYLHSNEFVLPKAQVSPLPAGLSGIQPVVIHTHIHLRDREIAEAVVAVSRDREARLTGASVGRRWEYVA